MAMNEQIPAHVEENLSRLEQERGALGISREQLQRKTGVRADILQAWEEGRGRPTKSKNNRLAKYFGWEVLA